MFRRMDGESLLGLTLVVFGIVIIIAIAWVLLVGAGGAPAYTPAPQRCVGEWNGSRYIERCD
jgi:hypothetical protein